MASRIPGSSKTPLKTPAIAFQVEPDNSIGPGFCWFIADFPRSAKKAFTQTDWVWTRDKEKAKPLDRWWQVQFIEFCQRSPDRPDYGLIQQEAACPHRC